MAIQLVRRAFLAKKELKRLREEARVRRINTAATSLQCWRRGVVATRLVAERRASRRDAACRVIQRLYRGFIARRMYYALHELSQRLKRPLSASSAAQGSSQLAECCSGGGFTRALCSSFTRRYRGGGGGGRGGCWRPAVLRCCSAVAEGGSRV